MMNGKQKIVLGITGLLIIISVLFPHYVTTIGDKDCGYGFIGAKIKINTQRTSEGLNFYRCKVDEPRMIIQIILITVLGTSLVFVFRKKNL